MCLPNEFYINFIGTGTGIPSPYRGSPCIFIGFRGHCLVLDLGPGSLRALAGLGVNFHLIDAIWLTHFHPDHTADLVHLLFATRYPKILRHRKPFLLAGPSGLSDFIRNLQRTYTPYLELPEGLIQIEEMDPALRNNLAWRDLQFTVAATKHTDESIAIRLDSTEGKSIVYSGDTDFSQDLVELARGADLLILEASFPDTQKVSGHLTPGEAGDMASQAGVKKLVLTHFYPECLATDIAASCRKHYGGEIILASDRLRLVI